jgi:GTP-binding protein Era
MAHRAGFVNIIGYPNVGKSTLMNKLVGEKLSIITPKAQTTRHRIMGIINEDEYQIVFSDTPGIVRSPAYKMHDFMNKYIETALIDADVILLLTEPGAPFQEQDTLDRLNSGNVPVIVLINKVDLFEQQKIRDEIEKWSELIKHAEVVPVSALEGYNLDKVFDLILEKLPESPPYYGKDDFTDKSMRFFVSEIIREKILMNYRREIPYEVEVAIDSYKEEDNLVRISALVFTGRESQKAILLGHQGKAIKKMATEARLDIESFIGKKVFLEITVKVKKDWRDNENMLKQFGYDH